MPESKAIILRRPDDDSFGLWLLAHELELGLHLLGHQDCIVRDEQAARRESSREQLQERTLFPAFVSIQAGNLE